MALEPNPSKSREQIGLPMRPFLYTLDQIATLIATDVAALRSRFIYFDGRSTGRRPPDRMWARNIAEPGDTPEWRVAEAELLRWLRRKGYRFYERGYGVS